MSINFRIKELRKTKGLNQKDFGQAIGLKQGAISWMEQDGNTVTEQNIRLICDTFNVSEKWLCHGEGDIFRPKTQGVVEHLRTELHLSDAEVELMELFVSLPNDVRRSAIDFVKTLSAHFEAHPMMPPSRQVGNIPSAQQGTGNAPAAQGQPFGNSEQFQQANADPAISPTKKVSESDTFHAGNISPADAEAHRLLQQELDAQKKAAPPSPSGGLKRA